VGVKIPPAQSLRRRLRWLDLQSCPDVTDHSLFLISYYCRGLTALACSNALGISDAGLGALAHGACTKSMLRLSFEHCRGISGAGANAVLQSFSRLEHASFRGCSNIGDEIEHSIQNLHHLRTLDLSGCLRVSDNSIALLPRTIRHLRLRGLSYITNDGIQRVLHGGRFLESIDLSNCERITQSALLPLLHKGGCGPSGRLLCPSLHTILLSGCLQVDPAALRAIAALRRKMGVFARHPSFGSFMPIRGNQLVPARCDPSKAGEPIECGHLASKSVVLNCPLPSLCSHTSAATSFGPHAQSRPIPNQPVPRVHLGQE